MHPDLRRLAFVLLSPTRYQHCCPRRLPAGMGLDDEFRNSPEILRISGVRFAITTKRIRISGASLVHLRTCGRLDKHSDFSKAQI